MNIADIQQHGDKAVQYLEWAVSELNTIQNYSLAEHLTDIAGMLEANLENLAYPSEDEYIMQKAEEQVIYDEFG